MGVCGSDEDGEAATRQAVHGAMGCTQEEMRCHLVTLWNNFDQNEDGLLSSEELARLIQEAVMIMSECWDKRRAAEEGKSANRSEATLRKAKECVDVKFPAMHKPEYLEACVLLLDKNKDGKIEKEEFMGRAEGILIPGGTAQHPVPEIKEHLPMRGLGASEITQM
eukprot:TRINITY_DN3245_c0_g1_i1.p1 TRINITY_DN3245_c0_g1~~TRINITY_DN3245_c0_g1_i1.p1  ORF type:complete len:166 (+),score=54.09 TRINITY_DN3245_c0_g1_i1:143-640(+)